MNREELISWSEKYDNEEDLYNKGDEKELGDKFRQNNFVTKEDLHKIIKWKFQGRLIGRRNRVLKLLDNVEGSYIEDASKLAFKYQDDKIRVKLFSTIDGIGSAITTVILAFYDPKNYGVFDIHAWRGLFGKEPKDLFTNTKHAIHFFDKLRDISKETGLSCRTIEKAYFKMDLDRSKA